MGTRHIVYMGLVGLAPAARNPKAHDLPTLVESLRRFGWTNPAVLDERTGRLVAGHGRREACIILREQGDPPPGGVFIDDDGDWLVPVLRGWSSRDDAEADAYIVADNRISEAGGWDTRELALLLEDVVTADAGLIEVLGYTADDLDAILRQIDPETMHDDDRPLPAAGDDPEDGSADEPATVGTVGADDATLDERDAVPVNVTCPNCSWEFER